MKADLKLFKTRLFRFWFLERRDSHALPVGGANAPFRCLSIANKHQEDEEEGKAEERQDGGSVAPECVFVSA